ncbi:MAG TPA: TonB-dependent receptor [Terriglobales bacterium]|nr:TonB-dependent receptor [Terriglobales bacterium]
MRKLRVARRAVCLSLWLVALSTAAQATDTVTVEGVVRDPTGSLLRSVVVKLRTASLQTSTQTNEVGYFVFHAVPSSEGEVSAEAEGFTPQTKPWMSDGLQMVRLDITLQVAAVKQQIVVSSSRTELRLSEAPGSAILLSSKDVAAAPALRIDDLLRQVPGFSLFRRSGSRTANPSAQGVSLRGLGGSAASRAFVAVDGIPLVDPFGGWIYWDRIPRVAVSSVEVFRGGSSSLYGSSALGGVVQLTTRQPGDSPSFELEGSYGNERTPQLSIWAGNRVHQWDYSAAAEMFHTDGFILVPDSVRGSVDTAANSEDATVYALIGHTLGERGRAFVRGSFFTEFRNNGTVLQTNDTHFGEGVAGVDKEFGTKDSLTARLYVQVVGYNQVFSAVAADRNSENLTDLQHVPEQVVGGAAQWTHVLGKSHTLIAGTDLAEVIGASNELLFSGPNASRNAGGRQRTFGFFGEDIFHRVNWTVIAALRADHWKNFNGTQVTTPTSGPSVTTTFSDRTDLALSPRLSVLRRLNNHLALTGSVYRAFRAPTLNELYRTFRVGNILTRNNAALNPERLTGIEAGVKAGTVDNRLSLRGTFFWSDIVDPVANVTLSITPTLITREKENLGRTRSRGVELDGSMQLSKDVQLSAGYAFTSATVVSYPGNLGGVNLVGLDVPQVPHNTFTWQARYWNPSRVFVSLTGRFVGQQYDDDQNQFSLDRFYTMDAQVGRAITRHLELFAAVENIFNQRYQVARTPVVNLGPPALVRAGLRLSFPVKEK